MAQHVWRPLQSPAVPPNIAGMLDDVHAKEVSEKVRRGLTQTPPFWLLVAALRAYVAQEHTLPLSGALPDMKATSETYVALQHLYVAKARRDFDAFLSCLDDVLDKAHLSRDAAGLGDDQVRTFVKHAAHLRLVRGRRLAQQRTDPDVGAMGTLPNSRSDGVCRPRESGHGAVPNRVLCGGRVLRRARAVPHRVGG